MAMTFPYELNGAMYFYDDSAGTWTARNYTTGDYFDDDSVVGDCIGFAPTVNYRPMALCIYVGTALVADSITLEWEYGASGTGWTSLTVIDGSVNFTRTGEQWILFDRPALFMQGVGPVGSYYWIRARITAVTNLTEGGANSTQQVKGQSPRIYVDGYSEETPATPADIETADLAGTRDLAPSLPCTTGMTILPPKPAGMGGQLLTFTLAGTSAGAGDTIDITGTGAEDQALTESIDVSAGDGDYTSAYCYKTVTSFDCTGWADGTVEVRQNRWGAAFTDSRGNLTIENCPILFETTSYFKMYQDCIIVNSDAIHIRTNGSFYMTGWADIDDSVLVLDSNFTTGNSLAIGTKTAPITFDGSSIITLSGGSSLGSAVPVSNCFIFSKRILDARTAAFENNVVVGSYFVSGTDGTVHDLGNSQFVATAGFATPQLWIRGIATGASVTCRDVTFYSIIAPQSVGTNSSAYLINVNSNNWMTTVQGTGNMVYRQYELDVHVADEQGSDIEGATVLLEDKNGTQAFSLTTDAGGDITTTAVTYGDIDSDTNTWTYYYPFKLTISKAGYKKDISYLDLDVKTAQEVVLSKVKDLNFSKHAVFSTQ